MSGRQLPKTIGLIPLSAFMEPRATSIYEDAGVDHLLWILTCFLVTNFVLVCLMVVQTGKTLRLCRCAVVVNQAEAERPRPVLNMAPSEPGVGPEPDSRFDQSESPSGRLGQAFRVHRDFREEGPERNEHKYQEEPEEHGLDRTYQPPHKRQRQQETSKWRSTTAAELEDTWRARPYRARKSSWLPHIRGGGASEDVDDMDIDGRDRSQNPPPGASSSSRQPGRSTAEHGGNSRKSEKDTDADVDSEIGANANANAGAKSEYQTHLDRYLHLEEQMESVIDDLDELQRHRNGTLLREALTRNQRVHVAGMYLALRERLDNQMRILGCMPNPRATRNQWEGAPEDDEDKKDEEEDELLSQLMCPSEEPRRPRRWIPRAPSTGQRYGAIQTPLAARAVRRQENANTNTTATQERNAGGDKIAPASASLVKDDGDEITPAPAPNSTPMPSRVQPHFMLFYTPPTFPDHQQPQLQEQTQATGQTNAPDGAYQGSQLYPGYQGHQGHQTSPTLDTTCYPVPTCYNFAPSAPSHSQPHNQHQHLAQINSPTQSQSQLLADPHNHPPAYPQQPLAGIQVVLPPPGTNPSVASIPIVAPPQAYSYSNPQNQSIPPGGLSGPASAPFPVPVQAPVWPGPCPWTPVPGGPMPDPYPPPYARR